MEWLMPIGNKYKNNKKNKNNKKFCLINKIFLRKYRINKSHYDGGNGAKHNLISPNEATSYLTINGKSLPKYISK